MNFMLSGVNVGIIVGVCAIIAAVVLVIALIAFIITTYNTLVKMRNNCEEAWATIDVYLKKRYDLIPNIVETVKGYASHESQTLTSVIAARNKAMNAGSIDDKMAAENQLTGCLKTLFSLTENYPNLKADSQFLDLQKQLQTMETEIGQSRKYYNGVCKGFNTKTEVFPANLIAGVMKLQKRKYFEIENDAERQNVKVSF